MKLALIIDANPRVFRCLGGRSRLRPGEWTIKSEGMVDSEVAVYHALIDKQDKIIGEGYERHVLEPEDSLRLKGPAFCYVEFLKPGKEKSISIFAYL